MKTVDRIASVADFPYPLASYRAWLSSQSTEGPRDYLFTEKRSRFEPRREDVVVLLDDLTVTQAKSTTVLRCGGQSITIPVPDVAAEDARRIVEAIDGRRCLLEVQLDAKVEAMVLALMLRAAFGRVILTPAAVEELEKRISSIEIARFPGAPYGVMRSYWRNMAEVRERLASLPEDADAATFVRWLREAHVVALMGEQLDSFYKPASPGADTMVAPGALFTDDVRVIDAASGPLFLSGPRVNAKLIGGEAYHAALYGSVGDREALTRTDVVQADGLRWGSVVTARSERDPEPTPWFCPPRPLSDAHFQVLHQHWQAAWQGDAEAAARFHWCFVRLHPFHCGNQCIAMNLVNAALAKSGTPGIPHLVLDHFALRLTQAAYVELFGRAVAAFSVDADPAARVTELMKRNEASYAFIAKLKEPADALRCGQSDPEGARAALLRT